MTKERRLALEVIVLAMVLVVAVAVFLQGGNTDPGLTSASPTTRTQATSTAASSASTRVSASPAIAASPSVGGTGTAVPSANPRRTSRPTSPPRTSADPHLAYADFLSRVNADRSKVDTLDRALSTAVTAGDRAGARTAATAILDFVNSERQWLVDHPPADCYAAAHAAGIAMLAAYQTAASDFVDWAGTSGLAGLVALAKAGDAATAATNAFTAFGNEIVKTQCPA